MALRALNEPQPGAKRLVGLISSILVLIFLVTFLHYADKVQREVELVAMQREVNNINSFLMIRMLEYVVKNNEDQLPLLNDQNPFEILKKNHLSNRYFGEIESFEMKLPNNGWYFDTTNNFLVYQMGNGEARAYYQLKFLFEDENNSGSFEKSRDKILALKLQKKAPDY